MFVEVFPISANGTWNGKIFGILALVGSTGTSTVFAAGTKPVSAQREECRPGSPVWHS
jgi:hypothetical protein